MLDIALDCINHHIHISYNILNIIIIYFLLGLSNLGIRVVKFVCVTLGVAIILLHFLFENWYGG